MPASAVPAAPGGRPGGRGAPPAGAERRRLTATGARVPPSRRVEEVSAGGLVLERASRTARVVLIGRLDRRGRLLWSLPKGHVEAGETHQDTAIREVREETGITGRVLGPLGCIDFWFTADGRRVHKTVHHFLLLATGGELSDADVEVTEVAWVPLAQAPLRLAYPTERALVERVPFVLADTA